MLVTDEFAEWFASLADAEARVVTVATYKLKALGVGLPYPHSSNIEGALYGIRELRPKAGASPLRVFYAFDPGRNAVLLIGGDKARNKRLYERLVRDAESIFARYLAARELEVKHGR